MESPSDRIAALVADLKKAEARSAELLAELTRSIAIKELWPDAFENGSVSVRPSFDERRPGKFGIRQQILSAIIITKIGRNGPDATRKFATEDLPMVLRKHYDNWEPKKNGHN